ncbi:glycerol-3-phosphate 1-O-acyltransferase [Pseudidiomarina sediminum]|uniref:Glycerol-3-phosphate acyltransferase n=1 Tax=Pseudidiomarina sediminum TaxID=431675 RepID=A0A432ZA36_9GAMM|nr:glycerol-3-phosphate 1-O-acyltransferase PlsB [Pseudidiomarina sediminum]MBY6064019.1 glycerol-3-phosphate 1-O-acyltransferase PlsB [Pseudidiomarina sediminum]RUO74817.1 glycerol-3-phosphate 1-O-acyltransferase [Pseudidiomarina sediminum]
MSWRSFVAKLMYWPVRWLTRFETIFDETVGNTQNPEHVVYVMRSTSVTDYLLARRAMLRAGLPDPAEPLIINGERHARVMYLEQARTDTNEVAIDEFLHLLQSHKKETSLNVQLVPLGLFWGRKAGQEPRQGNTMVADLDNPGRWRKFWLVMFSGRNVLIRVSRAVSLRQMTDDYGAERPVAHKLARVARVHFVRLRHAVAGPKVVDRERVIRELLQSAALQKAIAEEARAKKISLEKAEKRAQGYLDEIAAKYSETLVRMLDRFMGWMWSRIYNGIHVEGGERLRALAQAGHEIVYVPCHRSHMDYLLLSYVIYKEGLVPPHIAAGVNLDFFPAGPLFRRGGAFFIRRSFKGNKLYSAVFREYLDRLFQRGYPVEYFTEGGRSRTGRLLQPKTGMIAMTLQGMLRGQQRPMSIVPVYLGYEHVMEVGTYLKELKGKSKENESIWQVISSLRHLRNFGQGYVTFGEPINVGQTLDALTPDWRDSITIGAEEPARPRWLTPTVNLIADQIMCRINDAAGLNSVNLTALALLSAEQYTLSREELVAQLDVYTHMLRQVPYSKYAYVPEETGEELWQLAKRHDKFTVVSDSMGEMIRLDGTTAIAMTYYRNNIMHMMIVPALVASFACAHRTFNVAQIGKLLEQLQPLLKEELFISHERDAMSLWGEAIVEHLASIGLIESVGDCTYRAAPRETSEYFQLHLLARAASETLQRYAIIFELLQQAGPQGRAELEQAAVELAERLSAMHGVNAPEFFDKKLLSALVSTLKREDFIDVDSDGNFVAHWSVGELSDTIDRLLEAPVVQTIRQSVQRRIAATQNQ